MTDGPCDAGQNSQVRLPKFVGNIASDAGAGSDRLSITKAFSQPSQDSLSRKVKHWFEGSPNDVCLGAAVVLDICRSHLLIEPQVASGGSSLDSEARCQVLTTDFTHKPQPQLDVSHPVTLGVSKVLQAISAHLEILVFQWRKWIIGSIRWRLLCVIMIT